MLEPPSQGTQCTNGGAFSSQICTVYLQESLRALPPDSQSIFGAVRLTGCVGGEGEGKGGRLVSGPIEGRARVGDAREQQK